MIDLPNTQAITEVTYECIEAAAERFDLNPTLIQAILQVEGGRAGEKSKNTNGTYDLGPMQINTLWLKKFSPYVTEVELTNNGCTNVMFGSWILKANIIRAGNFWQGVGNYHSKTPRLHEQYQQKVYQASLNLR